MRGIVTVLAVIIGLHTKTVQCSDDQAVTDRAWVSPALLRELQSPQFWMNDAQRTLQAKLQQSENRNIAKNVIFFLGDGMSVPTVTAGRIYDGQLKGIIGERNRLSFEHFPYIGLSKTYCVDRQVPDSACTATAYLCGVKANFRTIGVTANVATNDCEAANRRENQLHSIAAWALDAGKSAGIVTTTRVTHASPAGTYAHTSHRDFESDYDVVRMGKSSVECNDIAKQLVENEVSRRFTVILGGGTDKFVPNNTSGERLDGRNLMLEWVNSKQGNAKVVQSRSELLNVNVADTDYLLGLFSPSHMTYHLDKDNNKEPLLEEMTEAAIKMLRKNSDGYFLFIEGGRIDHGHHETRARKALDETSQFANAIQKAYDLTDLSETLIVVTADHGHTMTINGYPTLNNDITGLNTEKSNLDGLPYTTLSYANGPAFKRFYTSSRRNGVRRVDLRKLEDLDSTDFQYPVPVPMVDETHGGGDVAIYANGPWSHLFTGVMEQNTIPALMAYAACIGPGLNACKQSSESIEA